MNNRLLAEDGQLRDSSSNDDNNNNNNNNNKSNCNNNNEFLCGVIEGFYGKPWTFGQRKDLFKRLKDLNLNSFLYAPKDDCKHRAKWRKLYSESEANELRILIEEAKTNGIDFYYSLAPGLDMVYSDQEDLATLIRKYDQIVSLGCQSFAILFDDIEPILNDKDKQLFENYAFAQVSIANKIFDHLKRPKFLFCPTEYCESRAVPNVTDSIYLNTIGNNLNPVIDFLWSGSSVISRLITENSIETLSRVIKRPPVIWENLHANDYDKKRIFLGPYSGRSTKIIPKLRGVLTNPNCEYEANHIAIHTLAQWSRCTEDINLNNICNPDQRVPASETNRSSVTGQQQNHLTCDRVYDPDKALVLAIRDWLPHLLKHRPLPPGTNLVDGDQQFRQLSEDESDAANQLAKETNQIHDAVAETYQANDQAIFEDEGNVVDMVPDESQSSESSVSTSNKSEMDISNSIPPTPLEVLPITSVLHPITETNLIESNSCDSCEMQDANPSNATTDQEQATTTTMTTSHLNNQNRLQSSCVDCLLCSSAACNSFQKVGSDGGLSSNHPASSCSNIQREQLDFDHLSLLVDLFYLPFEHGSHGRSLLKDIKWLRDNSDILITKNQREVAEQSRDDETEMNDDDDDVVVSDDHNDQPTGLNRSSNNATVEYWTDRAEKLNNLCACITRLVNTLIYNCPNQLLIMELYPYLIDMRDVTSMIIDYIKFLRYRTPSQDHLYHSNSAGSKLKESTSSADEQEPWVHRGGLVGDVRRLLSS